MARWDILRQNQAREAELIPPRAQPHQESNDRNPSVGDEPTDGSSANTVEKPERTGSSPSRSPNRRTQYRDRDRTYTLRRSEITVMTDAGMFRTVEVRDLARFVYEGNEARLKYDLENLRAQGLIDEKTVFRAHRSARTLITLTARGERLARRLSGLPQEQKLYHGFVKPKELDHDADLYKVYQKAVEEIRKHGGRLTRVKLDFELKEAINRAKNAGGRLADDERKQLLVAVAKEQGLTVDGEKIHLPDIQVEYQTCKGQLEKENLELVSRNYREGGIRGKAAAGFRIYARSADSNRIRRALHDTGMVREVLSV